MKKLLLVILLLSSTLAWGQKTPNQADYTTVVHVQSTQLVRVCTNNMGITGMHGEYAVNCVNMQHLNVVINGKKFELSSKVEVNAVFRTGDYKAKEILGAAPPAVEYNAAYDFLFPDGRTRTYVVVGESE
ncbi:MAG: hypothetical protein ABSC48_01505 [Terracidiphilus sp.]|jgi:hypothetical protein